MAMALALGSLALVVYGATSLDSRYGADEGYDSYMRDEYPMYSRHC